MRAGTTSALALVALIAGSIWAPGASAGFVPALGSPFAAGAPARALDVADVDGDLDLDVVAGGLRRFHNDGTGRLGSSMAVGAPGAVEGLAGGDLDGDSRRDWVAIAPGSPRTLRTYTALAGGGYDEDVLLADAGAAVAVAVADLDGAPGPDIVLADGGGGANVTVLLDDGVGGHDAAAYPSGLPSPADLAVGDLTGDGAPDLALVGGGSSVAVLANDGDGSFAAAVASPTGAQGTVERIALGSVAGGGALDAVVADAGGMSAVIALRGEGDGVLSSLGRWPTGLAAAASALALGDLDGDGRTDAVAGAGGGFAALLGSGTGAFAPLPGSPFATGAAGVADLAVADMNGDRQRDVVAAAESGSLAVALNTDTGLMEASPSAVAFGALPALAPAMTQTVTFRSTRGQLHVTRADVYGPGAFSAGGGCVGRTLLRGQACTMTVTFTPPREARQRVALLSLDANAAVEVVPLTATVRPPLLARVAVRPRRVRAGGRLALSFELSEDARVRAVLERGLPGRLRGRRCVPGGGGAHGRRCRAWAGVRTLSRRGVTGVNGARLRASAGGRRLEPGTYRLALTAADRFRNRSDETYARFRVRKPRPPRRVDDPRR